VSLVGFDINENIICLWEYNDTVSSALSINIAKPVEIEEPLLSLKKNDKKKKSSK
jgi:hypothetical protein